MHNDREIRALIAAMERGEPDALERFRTLYTPLLRYIIAPILSDPRDREECLADAIHRAWDKIHSYETARGNFPTWLSAIARNAALNRLRELGRQPQWEPLEDHAHHLADPSEGPEQVLLRNELAVALNRALSQLSQRDRDIFLRKYYYYQSTAQIAAELGLTLRGAEGRLYRIRKRLQKDLGGEWHD